MIYRIEVTDPIPQTTISKQWFPSEKAAWAWVARHEDPLLDYAVLPFINEHSTIPYIETAHRER